jgi:hypothetical protein
MKTFVCHCGNTLYFENSRCLVCKRMVGYLPDDGMISALEPQDNGNWLALVDRHTYRMCKNYSDYNVCNWMVPAHDPHPYCLSCRLNHIIPNLGEGQNLTLWYRIESAKRRLLYTLYELHLPVIGRHSDPKKGLAFEFLADETSDNEFRNELIPDHHVITGHRGGIITINLREAEDSAREVMREKMNERYRTLLGHFRHEIGHYYWDRLIVDMDRVGEFRRIFGDERQDYEQSLRKYYQDGPPSDWQSIWISAYASAHPWEDWGESWAHYMHMVDTLETAHDFGFSIQGYNVSSLTAEMQSTEGYLASPAFDLLIKDWNRLTIALNAMNRSMGLPDVYPFVISDTSLVKLRFIHDTISASTN